MPKRVQFSEVTSVSDDDAASGGGEPSNKRRFKEKHSLDSDEEDEDEERKFGVMREKEIVGSEATTIRFDEGIKITPFNMREEMEEGHFDAQGNYVWNKEDEIKDAWMDNIDWVKVKHDKKKDKLYDLSNIKSLGESSSSDDDDDDGGGSKVTYGGDSDDSDTDAADMTSDELVTHYQSMLVLMRSGENVLKSIRRLGGGKGSGSASSRWSKKKGNDGEKKGAEREKEGEDKEGMLKLTSLADEMLQRGEVEIYEATYEKLEHMIRQEESKRKMEENKDDGGMDMFADEEMDTDQKGSGSDASAATSSADGIQWEYKVHNSDDSDIMGPFTSQQMLDMSEEGKFGEENEVYVRKVGTDSDFYSSKRIDFELYT